MFCLLDYIWIYLKLRKYCNFGAKNSRRAWHVFPAQEVNKIFSTRMILASIYIDFDLQRFINFCLLDTFASCTLYLLPTFYIYFIFINYLLFNSKSFRNKLLSPSRNNLRLEADNEMHSIENVIIKRHYHLFPSKSNRKRWCLRDESYR